jgi:hypothetical protein
MEGFLAVVMNMGVIQVPDITVILEHELAQRNSILRPDVLS